MLFTNVLCPLVIKKRLASLHRIILSEDAKRVVKDTGEVLRSSKPEGFPFRLEWRPLLRQRAICLPRLRNAKSRPARTRIDTGAILPRARVGVIKKPAPVATRVIKTSGGKRAGKRAGKPRLNAAVAGHG